MNKKSITILVVCLIVSVLSVSLAYYSTRIIGDGKNVSVNAKELTINFDNNNEIASGIIEPGWSSTNTFSVENKSKASFTYDIVLKNYKNTTKTNGYLVYKITSTNGYNMTEFKDMPKDGENTYDLVIARGITIEPGSSNKQSYTLEIKYLDSTEDQSIDMGSTVTGSLYIVESTTNENNPYTKGTLGYQIMEDNSNIKTRTDFSTTYTDVNIGTMYKAKEENTDVYYFAGDARNNWVKFGGYYWRIIRTNSDGSIRLLYAGTRTDTTQGYISRTNTYNEVHSDAIDVGYMYGTSGSLESNRTNENSSSMKELIDNWYKNNLTSYTKYLSSTAVYCNDRKVTNDTYVSSGSDFNFDAYKRIAEDKTPTYNCANINDAFSAGNKNAKLTYPIALMTADEISYAGGVFKLDNHNVWYNYNSNNEKITDIWWWLMTPWNYLNWYKKPTVFVAYKGGQIGGSRVSEDAENGAVRPVISIKGENIWKSGDGSAEHPYEIEEISSVNLAETIKKKSIANEDGIYNENGYRYEGSNPNNYITLINKSTNKAEMWRIIGIFNDGENEEEVIRVRKHYEQNNYPTMAYDTTGINHFPVTTMYSNLSNTYNLANFDNTVNFKMYLGVIDNYVDATASEDYTIERGTTPGKTAAANYANSVLFTGSVGLAYPSDYGYAVLASDCARTIPPHQYYTAAKCHDNNWLFQGSSQWQWLITSRSDNNTAMTIIDTGLMSPAYHYVNEEGAYSPMMALSADVKVIGKGTIEYPYEIVTE